MSCDVTCDIMCHGATAAVASFVSSVSAKQLEALFQEPCILTLNTIVQLHLMFINLYNQLFYDLVSTKVKVKSNGY